MTAIVADFTQAGCSMFAEVNHELLAPVSFERAKVLLVLTFASGLGADRFADCLLPVEQGN